MGKLHHGISEDLREAQLRLQQLRLQLRASHQTTPPLSRFHAEGLGERPSSTSSTIAQLPPHLGWESAPLTDRMRQTRTPQPENAPVQPAFFTQHRETAVPSPHFSKQKKFIKIYPDIAIGLLRKEQVAAGRLWLLLQVVDNLGRGWVSEAEARAMFTRKRSSYRFCGARQLRNLLVRGEAILWVRRDGRIWLRSVAKVAYALGITRLNLRPVALPVKILTQPIGTVRAHLYATFHSGRTKKTNNPIARTTVAKLTDVQPRTQRRYEHKARVTRQQQFAIGGAATVEAQQIRAWQQGQATFQFKDFKGKQGRAGSSYVAWQLPNSYVGPHAQRPKGRQKRINRVLTDLFMKGMTGNDQNSQVEAAVKAPLNIAKRFFGNGRLAANAYLRNPEQDHYWRGKGNGRYQLWLVMNGLEKK